MKVSLKTHFIYTLIEDTYVVWIASINRFIQFKEPAFFVFSEIAHGEQKVSIVEKCNNKYASSKKESKKFVDDISNEMDKLFRASGKDKQKKSQNSKKTETDSFCSSHVYEFSKKRIKFTYKNKYLKELIHPAFEFFEEPTIMNCTIHFELCSDGICDSFFVNGVFKESYPLSEINVFQGAVYLELLNILHSKNDDNWMGVLHASAISNGNSAVIFVAPSGSGKSTIAIQAMENGYDILSDDFVPICMDSPEVYQFPSGISVKTAETQSEQGKNTNLKNLETFVAPKNAKKVVANANTKAIVFIKYDSSTECDFTKVTGLNALDSFLKNAWIANSEKAVTRFFEWYFKIPVYQLVYSNNGQAMKIIKSLFSSE